jgi:hypothetical protein
MPLHEETSPLSGQGRTVRSPAHKIERDARGVFQKRKAREIVFRFKIVERKKAIVWQDSDKSALEAPPQETGKATQQVSGNRNQDDAPPAHGNVD